MFSFDMLRRTRSPATLRLPDGEEVKQTTFARHDERHLSDALLGGSALTSGVSPPRVQRPFAGTISCLQWWGKAPKASSSLIARKNTPGGAR